MGGPCMAMPVALRRRFNGAFDDEINHLPPHSCVLCAKQCRSDAALSRHFPACFVSHAVDHCILRHELSIETLISQSFKEAPALWCLHQRSLPLETTLHMLSFVDVAAFVRL